MVSLKSVSHSLEVREHLLFLFWEDLYTADVGKRQAILRVNETNETISYAFCQKKGHMNKFAGIFFLLDYFLTNVSRNKNK